MAEKLSIVDLQQDLFFALMSWPNIDTINVVQQRKMRIQNVIDYALIYTTARKSRSGIGILVEMPTFENDSKSAPGPATRLIVSLVVMENPILNMDGTGGTNVDAESLCELLSPFLHQWLIEGQGEFYPTAKPIAPANDLPPGCLGYRIAFAMEHSPAAITRATQPALTFNESEMTITLTNAGNSLDAEIYFTTDQTLPGSANSAAKKYEGPIPVEVGDVVRWCAWKSDWLPSAIGRATINL